MIRWERPRGVPAWLVFALGVVILLFGLPLLVGGLQLVALGGSWYYFLAGCACCASGVLLMLRRRPGAWIFVALFVASVPWAIWESGSNFWALVPRLVAGAVLLLLVLVSLPQLEPRPAFRAFPLVAVAFGILVAFFAVAYRVTSPEAPDPGALAADAAAPTRVQGSPADVDWPVYAGSNSARHYSPLTQIDRTNVGRLERAWVYRTGDVPDKRWGAETTPIKVGDSVYLCSARNILIALDARTGKERWRFDPNVPAQAVPYTAACRGVSYHAAPAGAQTQEPAAEEEIRSAHEAPPARRERACAERIIEGTLDARLIAVDARTGKPCADFGNNGQVDLKQGLGQVSPGMVSVTSPPVIVRDVVITGHQVLDGQRRDAPSGVIRGFDAVTGDLVWAWDLARVELTGWPPPGETYTRGTPNMWTIASADEELGLVYLPMGNSSVDYLSSTRSDLENRYSTALVALDATRGRPVWRFQTVHVDVWDYDLGSQATLIDFPTPAGPIPALLLPSKQGELYVLDRRTGTPLRPVEERPVPRGGAEPTERSPTQPFSLYHTLRMPDLTERDMWGFTPIDQLICRIQFRRAAYHGIYTPPTASSYWIEYPGYNGGSDWGGIGVDVQRGVIVANYNDMPNHNRFVQREEANRLRWYPRDHPLARESPQKGAGDPQMGTPYAIFVNAGWRVPFTGLLCKEPPYGGIRAIALASGDTIWDRPLGTARANGPFRIPSGLPLTIGTPNNGGPLLTASGLVFIAAATDNLMRAIDLATGETIWKDVLPAGGQATPMTYSIEGRQYVVIVAGGHHFMETPAGDHVIAYALPPD